MSYKVSLFTLIHQACDSQAIGSVVSMQLSVCCTHGLLSCDSLHDIHLQHPGIYISSLLWEKTRSLRFWRFISHLMMGRNIRAEGRDIWASSKCTGQTKTYMHCDYKHMNSVKNENGLVKCLFFLNQFSLYRHINLEFV